MTRAYELRRADGSLWCSLLYLPLAQAVAERDSRLADVGPLTITETNEMPAIPSPRLRYLEAQTPGLSDA